MRWGDAIIVVHVVVVDVAIGVYVAGVVGVVRVGRTQPPVRV